MEVVPAMKFWSGYTGDFWGWRRGRLAEGNGGEEGWEREMRTDEGWREGRERGKAEGWGRGGMGERAGMKWDWG